MTEHGHGAGHHPAAQLKYYFAIGIALAVFTAASFAVNSFVYQEILTASMGFSIILGVAIVKATLVGIYFMHLNHDWSKVGFMIIPAFILGAMMMFVLLPDIVLVWWGNN